MPPSLLSRTALPRIQAFFQSNSQAVYKQSDIIQILEANMRDWDAPQRVTPKDFLGALLSNTKLELVDLESPQYDTITRYTWGTPNPFLLALSIKPRSFLSHGTAAFLHTLDNEVPKTIYVNKEQSAKPAFPATLMQEAIDRAFANSQRSSQLQYVHQHYQYVVLSGKNTSRVAVHSLSGPNGETLETTALERTLIDMTVRPAYAGGTSKVLTAYRAARDRISPPTLLGILKNMAYTYPYHQAIGFYMEQASYPKAMTAPLKDLGLEFDFYLDYKMKKPKYHRGWRLFYPSDL
jgi:hypothetical protein